MSKALEHARQYHRRIPFAEPEVRNADGTLVARAIGTVRARAAERH